MVAVNHKNLEWARNAAGLERHEAAKKLGFADSGKSSAIEKLAMIESGDKPPTQPQLNKMANVYRQPVTTFYLDTAPRRSDVGEDFRTLPEQSLDAAGNARLEILVSNVKASQSITRDLLEDEDAEPLQFVYSASIRMGVERIANSIVQTVGFDLKQYRRRPSQPELAFNYLRSRIQSVGIFVLMMSDLGHPQTTTIPVSVFRGFALADDIAPYIVINRKDDKRAQSFTAVHEVAHIWLGSSGITGSLSETSSGLERLCNRVAGRILLPPNELEESTPLWNGPFEHVYSNIAEFAKARNVSQKMVAYNLRLENFIEQKFWQQLNATYEQEQLAREQREREQRELDRAQGKSTPVDPNKTKRYALGELLVELARRSVASGALTPTRASTLLGVNPRKIRSFLHPERLRKGI